MKKEVTGYVTAKNGYWYMVVTTRDETGKRVPQWINTGLNSNEESKEIAKNMLKEKKKVEKIKGQSISSQMLLVDFVPEWLAHYRITDVAPTTYEVTAMKVNHIINYFESKNVKIRDITPLMANNFYEYLRKEGKRNQKDGTKCPLSIRTVQDIKNLLNAIIDYAVMLDIIKYNPIRAVKVTRKRKNQLANPIQYMDYNRAKEFMEFVDVEVNSNISDLVWIALTFGLRRSEILGLREDSVNFKRKYLKISGTVTRATGVYKQDKTKTDAGYRGYNLSDTQLDRFYKIMKKKKENRKFYGKDYIETPYLITWESGKEYAPDYVTAKVKKLLIAFGEPDMSLHKLRYSAASILCEQGCSVKEIQYYLGHCDASTTLNIYTHIERQNLKAGLIEL